MSRGPSPYMLESVAKIKRPTIGRDTREGVTQDPFRVIGDCLPCSCQESGIGVQTLYAQRNTAVNTTIYFNQNPGTEVNDVIEVQDMTCDAPGIYLVKGEAQAVGRGILWNVDCERIRQPVASAF